MTSSTCWMARSVTFGIYEASGSADGPAITKRSVPVGSSRWLRASSGFLGSAVPVAEPQGAHTRPFAHEQAP